MKNEHEIRIDSELIRSAIRKRNMSINEFGILIGRGSGYICQVLNTGACRMFTAKAIADALGMKLLDIVETEYIRYLKRKGLLGREYKLFKFYG